MEKTGVRNSLLIYILAFTTSIIYAIFLFPLFSGTTLLELKKEKIKMDWIKKLIYTSIKFRTINLKKLTFKNISIENVSTDLKFIKKNGIYLIG